MLTGAYATSFVQGLQSQSYPQSYYEAVGCCKHAAAYSLENYTDSSGNQVTRMSFDAIVSPEDFTLTYLPAFRDCIQHGKARSVMCR